jgi:hypothetical protein
MPNQVSVIIPAHNRHDLLLRALHSVGTQKRVTPEVIVVDDGSQPPIVSALRDANINGVRVLRNEVRCNAAFSRNRGAQEASHNLLAFLDSDDIWFPSHLAQALDDLRGSDNDCLYVSRFGAHEQVNGSPPRIFENGYEFLFGRIGDPRSSTLVISKLFFEKVGGFDEKLEKYQDWDFALRCAQMGSLAMGANVTVLLDTSASGRMSAGSNLSASRRFLEKHAPHMSEAQLSRFFVGLLMGAAARSPNEHRSAVALFHEYLVPGALPMRYRAFLSYPKIGLGMMRSWLRIKRMF